MFSLLDGVSWSIYLTRQARCLLTLVVICFFPRLRNWPLISLEILFFLSSQCSCASSLNTVWEGTSVVLYQRSYKDLGWETNKLMCTQAVLWWCHNPHRLRSREQKHLEKRLYKAAWGLGARCYPGRPFASVRYWRLSASLLLPSNILEGQHQHAKREKT